MVFNKLGNCHNWSTRKLGISTLIYYISNKTYIMVSCTWTYTVHPIVSPNNPNIDWFLCIFVYFLKKFVHIYNIFGPHRNSVRWKWQGTPWNTILHRLTCEWWPGTPQKKTKITCFGWFSWFFVIFGHKWPHFGSPTNPFWVKTDRGPLKHCFPSNYHGYRTLLVKNHLRYTMFGKSWFEGYLHKMGV